MLESSTYNLNNDFIDPSILFLDKDLEDDGLYYFNARYYDSTTGRFINVDPIQDGTNWYVYCNNNPLNMIDPTGLVANFIIGAIVGGVVSATLDIGIQAAQHKFSGSSDAFKVDWKSTASSFAGGAVAGAITSGASAGATLLSKGAAKGVMIAGGIASGGASSATSTIVENKLNNEPITENLAENVVIGSALGGVFGASSKIKNISALAPDYIKETAKEAAKKSSAAGVISNITGELADGLKSEVASEAVHKTVDNVQASTENKN